MYVCMYNHIKHKARASAFVALKEYQLDFEKILCDIVRSIKKQTDKSKNRKIDKSCY